MFFTNWLDRFSRNLQRSMRRQRGQRRRKNLPHVAAAETLEIRQYPAASLTAALSSNGVLTIEGTNGNDQISVREANNQISVEGIGISKGGKTVASVSDSAVKKIVVNGLDGADYINLSRVWSGGMQDITKPTTLNGGAGNDVIYGGNGNDNILGDGGDDSVTGGLGNDTLNGGLGTDLLRETVDVPNATLTNTSLTGIGTDAVASIERASLNGGAGNNALRASSFSGSVTLWGGDGNDSLYGSPSDDYLSGEAGDDLLFGFAGNDILRGNDGNDQVWGGDGNDTLEGHLYGVSHDTLIGENGNDLFRVTPGDTVYKQEGDVVDLTHNAEAYPTLIFGSLSAPNHQDNNYVTLTTTGRLVIDLKSSDGRMDTYLKVFDQYGNLVASNDDYGGTLNSHVEIENAGASDWYRIEVSSYNGATYGPYELSIQFSPTY